MLKLRASQLNVSTYEYIKQKEEIPENNKFKFGNNNTQAWVYCHNYWN
jgi:hypothetical protein